jgi:hypothetical protein
MTRPGLFVLTTLCALGLSGLLTASAAEDAPAGVVIAGRVPLPLIEPDLGERTAAFSLKACIDCHASASTGSVAASASNFCQSCHAYAAVKLDCFECHSSKPADEGGVSPHGATPAATMQPARLP